MSISKDFKDYKEEIELALIQNACVEIELYSIISCIVREGKHGSSISLRDVSNRRTSKSPNNSNRLKGKSGFPDFVVLKREFSKNAGILGCIEAKMPTENLDNYEEQLNGHITSFNKVIYTNGIEWRFYDNEHHPQWNYELGKLENNEIVWNNDCIWNDLLKGLDEINWFKNHYNI